MKFAIILLSLLNGGYMLADGLFVLLKGKYMGPPTPGPWAGLFYSLGIDVFKLGPMFVLFGLAWLIFVGSFVTGQSWAFVYGLVIAVFTLWYFPAGTVISLALIVLLVLAHKKAMI